MFILLINLKYIVSNSVKICLDLINYVLYCILCYYGTCWYNILNSNVGDTLLASQI